MRFKYFCICKSVLSPIVLKTAMEKHIQLNDAAKGLQVEPMDKD